MTQQNSIQPESSDSPQSGAHHVNPRSELMDGLGWMVLGSSIAIASVLMDRLEKQDINPYTIPGLLPGLLGIVMTLLGLLLVVRSWRRGGRLTSGSASTSHDGASSKRIALVVGLCATFAVILVGHGLPFWAAGALFVTVTILCLQHPQRIAAGQKLTLRKVISTATIGLGAGLVITLVFQELFLVRLP